MSQFFVQDQPLGGGTDVESITTDDSQTVTPTGAGNVVFSGSVVANATNATPFETDGSTANTVDYQLQVGAAVTGAPGDSNDAGILSLNDTQFAVDANGYVSLAGGTDLPPLQTLTGDGSNAIGPDASGDIALTGSVVANATNAKPLYFDDSVANAQTAQLQVGTAIDAAPGDTNDAGILSLFSAEFDVDADGFAQLDSRVRLSPNYVENLAFDYNAGTGLFSVTGANGSALSATNPGFVTVWHPTDPNTLVLFKITADQTFTDGNGTSDIVGNTFGRVSADDWTGYPVPFFVYAVINDDADNVVFMICLSPNKKAATVTASRIGYPGQPQGDFQGSFFSFDAITTDDYNSNPCTYIGSFRMEKDASSDWFVSTLSEASDGVGKYNEETTFSFPLGVQGSASGTHLKDNGGTAPVFSTNNYSFRVWRNGMVECMIDLENDGGTDGAGAVTANLSVPYHVDDMPGSTNYPQVAGRVNGTGFANELAFFQGLENSPSIIMYDPGTATFLQNNDFGNGGRYIIVRLLYWMEEDA